MMRFQYGILSVLCFSHIPAAYGGGFQILGGYEAVDSLRPRTPSRPAPYMSEVIQRGVDDDIFQRAEAVSSKNMRCGYVNGTCPTGYWYVNPLLNSYCGKYQ